MAADGEGWWESAQQDMKPEYWVYLGEGSANMVLTYRGPHPALHGRVLRVCKRKLGLGSEPKEEAGAVNPKSTHDEKILTKAEQNLWSHSPQMVEARERVELQHAFLTEVMAPLLGSDVVCPGVPVSVTGEFLSLLDEHAFALRPVWRREESGVDTTCRKAQVVDDLTRVTLGKISSGSSISSSSSSIITTSSSSGSGSSNSSSSSSEEAAAAYGSLCVEIKPKCGFCPSSPFIAPANGVKTRVPRFQLHQQLKRALGQVHEVSGYDPRDLFSSSSARMLATLQALYLCPQNNLRIFHDGRNVLQAERHSDANSSKPNEATGSRQTAAGVPHSPAEGGGLGAAAPAGTGLGGQVIGSKALNPTSADARPAGVPLASSGTQDGASDAAELLRSKLAVTDEAAASTATTGLPADGTEPRPTASSGDASSGTVSSLEGLGFKLDAGASGGGDALPVLPSIEGLENLLSNFFGPDTTPLAAPERSVDAGAATQRGDGGSGEEEGLPAATASWRVHALLELVVRCLLQSRVLEKLLAVQRMDRFDVEGAVHCYYKYMGLPDPIALPTTGSGSSGGWGQGGSHSGSSSTWVEHSGELEGWGNRSTGGVRSGNQHTAGPVAGETASGEQIEMKTGKSTQGVPDGEEVKLRHSVSRCNDSTSSCGTGEATGGGGSEEPLLLPDTVEGCADVLRDFLISASAKDCSLMLAISPAPATAEQGVSEGSTGSMVCKWSGRTFLYKVCLIDLDIKRLDKVPKYYKLDQDIVRNYLRAMSEK